MATFDLNSTIGPIIDGVTALIPSILNLIVAVVPLIVLLAVVDFILELFGVGILGRIGRGLK